ncbi:hypothetical protein AK812_SmicGene24109 [Symbiodinium microadriaticum]|uniref:Uncharacterized protein n=1 Tax=Symbiodinium microadriaticum TaxID=2951 RepID=A0A1Q9DFJ8_SYMMI|nr:hypothetical protein AK812_SmicGene24109 [Symbiodinium microadriaticum]
MRLGVDDLESLLLLAPGLGVSCRGALDALGDCALEDCALEDCALEDRALGDGALLWLVVFWTRIALVKSVVAFVEQAVVELEVVETQKRAAPSSLLWLHCHWRWPPHLWRRGDFALLGDGIAAAPRALEVSESNSAIFAWLQWLLLQKPDLLSVLCVMEVCCSAPGLRRH